MKMEKSGLFQSLDSIKPIYVRFYDLWALKLFSDGLDSKYWYDYEEKCEGINLCKKSK